MIKSKDEFVRIIQNMRASNSEDLMAIMMLVMLILEQENPGTHIDISGKGMKFYLGTTLVSEYDVKGSHPVLGLMRGLTVLMGSKSMGGEKNNRPIQDIIKNVLNGRQPFEEEKGDTDGTQPRS